MRIITTAVAAALLALLAAFGIYEAAQPPVKQATTPLYDYGATNN
jgi:hypothetical protein